jgi:predicted SAM-dependent methyltransferase
MQSFEVDCKEPMKLNLGCSDDIVLGGGWVNVGLALPADAIVDLAGPWPWPESSVSEIKASHIIEHLPDRVHTMNSIWRVLVPSGRVVIDVPDATRGAGHVQDPTHCGPGWSMNSFTYFDDRERNWQRFHLDYGITAKLRVMGWLDREEGLNIHKYQKVWILHVVLEAIKP